MFVWTKLRKRISRLEEEQTRHCQELGSLLTELRQLREDRDKLLDQLNLAIIETSAKYPERKLVSRASTEYAEQEAEKKRRQQEQYAFLNAQAQAYPSYYYNPASYPPPPWVRYP